MARTGDDQLGSTPIVLFVGPNLEPPSAMQVKNICVTISFPGGEEA
jgi:hypothetical protein